ncbi:ferritin-like domain-containing protein [Conexibacter woesei]|uniref:DUF4439 domain-containing protein n=1 Tax=Conexibacter woesei (strain DSM 14684 / CCUG 47730 / CIP 108061 / JCM 11494 / NBRC 100937 / ID131577) TaxID=469383 RepID=D3F869_CONWI|nr:ferritin-like domain-containing protein [Conexibacter woesei]ADB48939.1 hypothetical protein Cwoe_0504 [Conexibacter woesei DSM 14684]
MRTFDRSGFLRLSAAGAGAMLGAGALALPARAALPAPEPKGEDLGFLQLGAIGERVSLELYRAAAAAPALTVAERRRAAQIRAEKVKQVAKLDAALGEDALGDDSFTITLPARELASRASIGRFGERLEALLVGVYLNGVQNGEDRSTRLLLGRLLAYDVQQLAWLRALRGAPNFTRVPSPLSVELAGEQLDRFLSTPGVEPS